MVSNDVVASNSSLIEPRYAIRPKLDNTGSLLFAESITIQGIPDLMTHPLRKLILA
jgi:hypothetical protein